MLELYNICGTYLVDNKLFLYFLISLIFIGVLTNLFDMNNKKYKVNNNNNNNNMNMNNKIINIIF